MERLVSSIAHSRTKTAFKAQTCLYVARGREFPVLLPTESGSDYTVFKQEPNNTKVSLATPNPATDQTLFSYHLDTKEMAQLQIFDIQGKLVHEAKWENSGTYTLNTNQMPSALYVYVIRINGVEALRSKLIITRP